MTDRDTIRQFLRDNRGIPVGVTPPRPNLPADADEDEPAPALDLAAERDPGDWKPVPLCEAPAGPGEHPERFIDGSHASQPVLCVRSPQGYPVPLLLAEVGAVALRLADRRFDREFVAVERVLGFVADSFPWEQVEAFAAAPANVPEFALRVLPARMPDPAASTPFDYEAMRTQAYNRCQNEMFKLEVLALSVDPDTPTLVDGQLGGRIGEAAAAARPLVVGVVKAPRPPALHPAGYNALLDLKPGQRTPYYYDPRTTAGRPTDVPLASWFLRLAGGPLLAPNWGTVRVSRGCSSFGTPTPPPGPGSSTACRGG